MKASDDAVVYGLRAALAVAERRPGAIRRVYHSEAVRLDVAPLLKATARERKPYNEVSDEDLRRLAGGVHHEGVVVVTDPLPVRSLEDLELGRDAVVLALDEVGNPHNLGAILRSAAWFGAAAVVVPRAEGQANLSAAAVRIAMGGAEHVPVVAVDSLVDALSTLRDRGLTIVGADQRARALDPTRPLPRPLCLLMGNESRGLGKAVRQVCHFRVSIPGTGAVESLNVSVSAGVLLALATAGR